MNIPYEFVIAGRSSVLESRQAHLLRIACVWSYSCFIRSPVTRSSPVTSPLESIVSIESDRLVERQDTKE